MNEVGKQRKNLERCIKNLNKITRRSRSKVDTPVEELDGHQLVTWKDDVTDGRNEYDDAYQYCYDHEDNEDALEQLESEYTDVDYQYRTVSTEIDSLLNRHTIYQQVTDIQAELSYIEAGLADPRRLTNHVKSISKLTDLLKTVRMSSTRAGASSCTTTQHRVQELDERVIDMQDQIQRRLKEDAPPLVPSTPVVSAPIVPHMQSLALEIPKYDGTPLAWEEWWRTFSTIMKENSYLTPHSQKCHFQRAMAGEACISYVNKIFRQEPDYHTAVEIIREYYEDPRLLHMYHHKAFHDDLTTEHTVASMQDSLDHFIEYQKALHDYGATDITQPAVMYKVTHMSPYLLTQWKKNTSSQKFTPQGTEYIRFMKAQIKSLGREEIGLEAPKPTSRPRYNKRTPAGTALQTREERNWSCSLCKEAHYLGFCPQYKDKSVSQRNKYVRLNRLCWNCLSRNHRSAACTSENRCRACGEMHHTTLHKDKGPYRTREGSSPAEEDRQSDNQEATTFSLQNEGGQIPPRLSATAMIVVTSEGLCQQARAQFDTGSSISLISQKLARTLKARRIPNSSIKLHGVNGSSISPYKVQITLLGRRGERLIIEPHVQESIVGTSTRLNLKKLRNLPFLQGLNLADPHYQSMSRIDLLLDVETTNACLLAESRTGPTPGMRATNSIFGWVLSGGGTLDFSKDAEAVCARLRVEEDDPIQIFKDLVALEDDSSSPFSVEEEEALAHFNEHVRRDKDGRYYVSLPRKQPTPQLGESRSAALRRYLSNERSLSKRGQWKEFSAAVDDYFNQGHAEVVLAEEEKEKKTAAQETYYLPMHGVIKEDSTTTKLRVVFDASATTTTGVSLNDTLLAGPSLHPLLTTILTTFRSNVVAFTADIGKMFRGIGLNPEEYNLHRFFHRGPDDLLQILRMKRLTFGIKSSPFLANQTLRKLSQDYQKEYPLAAELISSQFYVDDCLAGADTVEKAVEKITQAISMVKEACLELRKIRSNSPQLLARIPEHLRETADLLIPTGPSSCSKALGLHWGVREDALYVSVPPIEREQPATRRRVASMIARIFDILGFYSPAILPGRMILQDSWSVPGGWDAPLPECMQQQWKEWTSHLHNLGQHPIPRYLGITNKQKRSVQLHGFADASLKAFGAVIYLRSMYTDSSISVDFVTSKSRVVPKPKASIPRLELCSAVVLSKLMKQVMGELKVPAESSFYWADSTIVLCWIRKSPGELKTFVSNRVKSIQEDSDVRHWRHVDGILNPADLLSRGVPPQELVDSDRWWKGPPWLPLPISEWPQPKSPTIQELPEVKITTLAVVAEEEFGTTWNSTFDELVRATVHMRRFLHQENTYPDHVSIPEYLEERRWLLRKSQQFTYPKEYALLQQKKILPRSSSLATLCPYLDAHGVIRVGGRLQRAGLKPTSTHPVILSVKSATVQLFIKKTHEDHYHAGASTIMAVLAFQYHIPTLKRYLRKLSRSCVRCRLQYSRTSQQQMGELPECRTQISRPFSRVGVDFAGPFKIRRGRVRDPVKLKAYVCVFICYTSHATHLELVSDLTTEAFLAALTRFVSRRGHPERIESDNGSNFVGASSKLRKLTQHLRTPESRRLIEEWSIHKTVEWRFTPPRSPHFGGLWEAAVGSMKGVLAKTMKPHQLDFEEFATVLSEVEAILNSRPLIPLDAPADDAVEPLTPGHFLTGAPLTSMPFETSEYEKISLLRRWNLVKRLQHDLWGRWKTEYLSRLHKRQKNVRPIRSFRVGDVVIERNVDTFQRVWPLAVVTRVKPGLDGLVRVVDIRRSNHKDSSKPVTRGVENLVHLFSEPEDPSSEGGECLGQEQPGSSSPIEDGEVDHREEARRTESERSTRCTLRQAEANSDQAHGK